MLSNKKKILVVDVERPIAELIAEFCEMLGYETQVLNSGTEVLDAAKKYSPDLITLDLSMPDVPGSKVLKILKKDEKTRNIPVVVVSALIGTGSAQVQETFELSQAMLSKPLRIQALQEKLTQILPH